MTLREARVQFSRHFATLVLHAFSLGYEVAIDEVAEHLTVKDPSSDHMKGSLHHSGCAGDLILYDRNGNWLSRSEDYSELGGFWEALDSNCCWGGHFADGNHFSFAPRELFGGRK